MARYIDEALVNAKLKEICDDYATSYGKKYGGRAEMFARLTEDIPTADVSEQIIRKKAEVSEYWKNNVKQYRAMQGYSDIEHDTDNFLRGYNEAVEDMLAILDGEKVEE